MDPSAHSSTPHRPPLYEKGTASMWDDDHISRQLLALHLDPESDAASRKRTTIEKTVQWIESFCGGSPKTILDLGCGPGLYSRILAAHGHTVTGIDLSARSIDHARSAAAESGLAIEYIRKNYLDLDYSERFDIALMIYCDFDVLVPEDRNRLLKNVWRSLRPGGLFIFDTLNEKAPGIMNVPSESREGSEGGFWRSGPYEALSETFHYPEAGVILQQHTVCPESGPRAVYRFWTHYYREDDLAAILAGNGFTGTEYHRQILPDNGSGAGDMVTFCVTRKDGGLCPPEECSR